jgi:IS1 family transposase
VPLWANEQMRGLPCQWIEVDEIWSYVGKKQMHLKPGDDRRRLGDQWTFVAIDPEMKLVPGYRIGKRSRENAVAFMTDLSERLSNRVQISSDSLRSYVDAVEQASRLQRCRRTVEAHTIGAGDDFFLLRVDERQRRNGV